MHVTKKTDTQAQAEQWLATPESLQAIQRLLAPASPLHDGNFEPSVHNTIGVYVSGRGPLTFVDNGSWIVKSGAALEIWKDARFRELYAQEGQEPAVAPQFAEAIKNFMGSPIQPTHPRALADLDDNIDQTFDRR